MRVRSWVWAIVLAMGAVGGRAIGQQSSARACAAPATSVAGVLRSLAARAGVVFVGQVQSIVPNAGVVEITFQVQQSVMGVGGRHVCAARVGGALGRWAAAISDWATRDVLPACSECSGFESSGGWHGGCSAVGPDGRQCGAAAGCAAAGDAAGGFAGGGCGVWNDRAGGCRDRGDELAAVNGP